MRVSKSEPIAHKAAQETHATDFVFVNGPASSCMRTGDMVSRPATFLLRNAGFLCCMYLPTSVPRNEVQHFRNLMRSQPNCLLNEAGFNLCTREKTVEGLMVCVMHPSPSTDVTICGKPHVSSNLEMLNCTLLVDAYAPQLASLAIPGFSGPSSTDA